MSQADGYETARAIVDAASMAPFTWQPYQGSTTDFAYLRTWVLNQVTSIYGVDASTFDSATVLSTSILRDFVHRALQQTTAPDRTASDFPGFLGWNDVGFELRYPAHGLCGEVATQEWYVFRAFGFQTNQINSIDGTPDNYRDSHATTEVYVNDLGKYIIQDATFNFTYRDGSGELITWLEARAANLAGDLDFDGFKNFRSYNSTGTYEPEMRAALQQYFEDHYLRTTWSWFDSTGARIDFVRKLFLDWTGAHNPSTWQGNVYDTATAAQSAVAALVAAGQGWETSAQTLRAQGYYVSGFAFVDATGAHTTEWLTLRLTNGDYVSISRAGDVLNGSFDQLQFEATGGTVHNPGVDLSAFVQATYLIAVDGTLMNSGVGLPGATDQFGTDNPDTLVGDASINRMFGYAGNDILDGRWGPDYMAGGTGNDAYFIYTGTERLIEQPGEGIDTIYAATDFALQPNFEILNLVGPALKATIKSGEGWLYGNANNNVFETRGAVGHMFGGTGNDIYFLDNPLSTVGENPGEGTDTIYAYCDYVLPANVEILNLKGAAIRATMSSGEVWSTGNANDNIFDARGAYAHLSGLTGNDTYYIDDVRSRVTENANEGTDTVYAYVDYTMPANVEILNLYGSALRGTINAGGSGWIYGNANDNILDARGGVAQMYGGLGNDTYYIDNTSNSVVENANQGIDIVYSSITYTLPANVENLTLTGTAAVSATGNGLDNALMGNSGNNSLNGGAGADLMTGGAGNDTYYVDNPGDVVVETAGQGTDTVYAYVDYTMPANAEILNLYGPAMNGTINAGGNGWIYGNANDNVLDARGGTARLYGGSGSDTYFIDDATDSVIENPNEGTDTINSTISYTLPANVENLTLTGSGSIDGTGNELDNTLTGNAGNNVLNGAAGADIMTGGAGNDSYYVDNPGDVVVEVAGEDTDTVYAYIDYTMPANTEVLNLYGSAMHGSVNAGGDGWIYGNANDNVLDAQNGTARLYGGAGNDTYFIDDSTDAVTENANEGTDTVRSSITYALPANVENLTLTGSGNINGTGNGLDNSLTGNAGDNALNGGAGADLMKGGTGNDTYYVDHAGDRVLESMGDGSDTVITSVSFVLIAGSEVEWLRTYGSSTTAPINLTGNEFSNTLVGNAAANLLDGGAGADAMTGGLGNDTYYVDNAGDVVSEAVGGGNDTVITRVSFALSAGSEVELLRTYGSSTTNPINLTGNEFSNTLVGNAVANVLNGGAGADTMNGGRGDDTYYVDNPGDAILESADGGRDTVITGVSFTLSAGVEVEVMRTYGSSTTAPIDLTGNEFSNTLIGNAAANVLNGGGGADVLYGFGGADVFWLGADPASADELADFSSSAGDRVALHAADFGLTDGAGIANGALSPDWFEIGINGTMAHGEFLFNDQTNTLSWDPDGAGLAAQMTVATYERAVGLPATDFLHASDFLLL